MHHELSYERDEEMANNGGFPLISEDDLIKLYSKDRKVSGVCIYVCLYV